MKQSLNVFTRVILAAALSTGATVKAATNPDPGDYTGLPAGTDISLISAVNASGEKVVRPQFWPCVLIASGGAPTARPIRKSCC